MKKNSVHFALVVFTIFCTVFKSCVPPSTLKILSENSFLKTNEELNSALEKKDFEAIFGLLHDSVTWKHSNGYSQNLEQVVQDLENRKIDYIDIQILEIKNIKRKKSAYTLQSIVRVEGKYEGVDFDLKLLWVDEWRAINQNWKLLKRTSTKL